MTTPWEWFPRRNQTKGQTMPKLIQSSTPRELGAVDLRRIGGGAADLLRKFDGIEGRNGGAPATPYKLPEVMITSYSLGNAD